jgi:hypothetical protein
MNQRFKAPYNCTRCNLVWDGNQKDGRREGWRFHGTLNYCPDHKQFQFSLGDRDL